MKFLSVKCKELRKSKKISIQELAFKLGISRRTIWSWEKGETSPTEKHVRNLAEILQVPVSEISNLEEAHPKKKNAFSDIVNSWTSISQHDHVLEFLKQEDFISRIRDVYTEIHQANLIIKAILTSLDTSFYIKDATSRYIIANDNFKLTAGLEVEKNIFGSSDYTFFSRREAGDNFKEDNLVLNTGESFKTEGFIPGTRKKKWGVITKKPIFDSSRKCIGLVGTFVDITERKEVEDSQEIMVTPMSTVKMESDRNSLIHSKVG